MTKNTDIIVVKAIESIISQTDADVSYSITRDTAGWRDKKQIIQISITLTSKNEGI